MTRKRKIIMIIITFVAALSIFAALQLTLGKRAHSAGDPEADFANARELRGDGRLDEAIALLKKIIRENPNTPIAASSHFELGGIYGFRMRDMKRMLQEYQTVADEYKGTPYGLSAEALLIDCNYPPEKVPFDTWIAKMDEFLVKNGGISVFEILKHRDNPKDEWRNKIHAMSAENRESFFPQRYDEIAARFLSKDIKKAEICPPRVTDKKKIENINNSITILLFLRQCFPHYSGRYDNSVIRSISSTIVVSFPPHGFPLSIDDKTPPVVKLVAPDSNERCGEHQSKIIVELNDGDISQEQVNLDKLVFTLDGKDITEQMKVTTHINRDCQYKPAHNGHDRCENDDDYIFEKIRLEYCPESSLSAGRHTLYIKAIDTGNNATEKTWIIH